MPKVNKEDIKLVKEMINSSPYYQLLGIEITDFGEKSAQLRMKVKDELFHAGGIVHGGAIASIVDSAVAIALISLGITRLSTIELKLNYLLPVSKGEIIAEAKIIYKGNKIAVGDIEVKDQDENLVAKGIATYMIG